jgi:hypothetical protein
LFAHAVPLLFVRRESRKGCLSILFFTNALSCF